MQQSQSPGSLKGLCFFYFWFLSCLALYFFKIPLHLLTDLKNLILSFQVCTWTWNQVFQLTISHFLTVFMGVAYLSLFLGTGEAILRLVGEIELGATEVWIWSLALGLVFWGLLAESLALTGLFYPLVLQSLSLSVLILFLMKDRLRALRRCWPLGKHNELTWPWKIVLGVFLILTFSNLLAPEMSWDAITYQLVLPRYYLLHHGFYSVSGIAPSQYPALGEMFFSWGIAWGDDSVARFFCFWVHLATAFSLMVLGTRLISERAGWYAAAFYGFFPYLNIYSTRGYVDLFAGFYATIGLGFLLLSVSDNLNAREEQKKRRFYFLVAFALGAVMAIKYNAIVYVLAAFFIFIWKLRNRKEGFCFFALLSCFSLFFFGPWVLKSWEYVRNPVYPYLSDWFHSFNWNEFDQRVSAIKFPVEGLKGIFRLPMILWGIFFNRYSGAPNEEVGLALLAFSPFLLVKRSERKPLGLLGLAAGIPFLFWLVTSHQLRLIIPTIALSSLAVGVGFEQALRNWKSHSKWLGVLPLFLAGLAAIYLFQGLLEQPNPYANFLGFQTRDQFLNQIMRPTGYVQLNNYLNRTLPVNAKVLILGQQNGYYLQRESVFDFDYTLPLLKEWADQSASPEKLYQWFVKNNVDYLLYNSNGMVGSVIRAEELGVERYFWTPIELRNYEQFFLKYTQKVPLAIGEGYSLYKIIPRNKEFSTLPEFLPGTEKYYLDDMVRLMGLRRVSDIVGRSVPTEIYAKAYNAVALNYSELGYPCFQSAMADLAGNGAGEKEVLKKGEVGFERNGDEASWLALKADVLLEKGRSKAALPLLEKTQLLGPEKDDVARNLAVAYYNDHQIDRAVQEAKIALDLAPYSEDYRKLLSQLQALELNH